jgi:hypothetical protein
LARRSVALPVKGSASSTWQVRIGALIEIFQRALITLVPTFDQARINWRGPNTYDDYERIAEALFDSIVRDALTNAPSVAKAYPPGRYSVHQPGREWSRIYVNDPEDRLAFYELETTREAFDTIACQRIDDRGRETDEQVQIPLIGARFTYEARFAVSPPVRLDTLDVEL